MSVSNRAPLIRVARTDGVLVGCVLLVSLGSLLGHLVDIPALANWSGSWSMTLPTASCFLLLVWQFILRQTKARLVLGLMTIAGVSTTLWTVFPGYSIATGAVQICAAAALAHSSKALRRCAALVIAWACSMGLANVLFERGSGFLAQLTDQMSFPTAVAGLSMAAIIARSTEPYSFRRAPFTRKHIGLTVAIVASWLLIEILFVNTDPSYNAAIIATVAVTLGAFAWAQRVERTRLHNRNLDLLESLDKTAIVAITNPQGEIVHINDLFVKRYGYSRDEVIGQRYSIVGSGEHEPEFWEQLWSQITSGKTWKGEICNKTKDGRKVWLESTINPLLDEEGRPELFLAIYFDITEQVEQQERLLNVRDQQSAMLTSLRSTAEHRDRLVQLVAHDLRSPLANTLAIVDSIESYELHEPGDAIERIKVQTRKALSELEEFLAAEEQLHSAKLSEQEHEFDPAIELLSELQTHTAQAEQKSIRIDLDPPEPLLFKGPLQLFKHVCRNLISNALKYTPESGTIRVALKPAPSRLLLTIEDSGPGIPPEKRTSLFRPFQSGENSATEDATHKSWGLGLSVVKELLTAQNGSLKVDDSKLGGARFKAVIPGRFSEANPNQSSKN